MIKINHSAGIGVSGVRDAKLQKTIERQKEKQERNKECFNRFIDEILLETELKDYSIVAARILAFSACHEKMLLNTHSATKELIEAVVEKCKEKGYLNYDVLSRLFQKAWVREVFVEVRRYLIHAGTDYVSPVDDPALVISVLDKVKQVATAKPGQVFHAAAPYVIRPYLLKKQTIQDTQKALAERVVVPVRSHINKRQKHDSLNQERDDILEMQHFNHISDLCSGTHTYYEEMSAEEAEVFQAFIREFCYYAACEKEKRELIRQHQETVGIVNSIKRAISSVVRGLSSSSATQSMIPALTMKRVKVAPKYNIIITEVVEGEVEDEPAKKVPHAAPREVVEEHETPAHTAAPSEEKKSKLVTLLRIISIFPSLRLGACNHYGLIIECAATSIAIICFTSCIGAAILDCINDGFVRAMPYIIPDDYIFSQLIHNYTTTGRWV